MPGLSNAAWASAHSLGALEKRFFEQEYSSEPEDKRLDRLEELVFGSTSTGSDSDRLKRLELAVNQNSVPDSDGDSNKGTGANSSPGANASPGAGEPGGNGTKDGAAPANATSSSQNNGRDDYPTVTAIEEQLLGRTYPSDSVEQRLSRLETKAFGKPSDLDDLGKRVDRLKGYMKREKGVGEDYLTHPQPQFQYSSLLHPMDLCQQLDVLERAVFGKSYSRDGLVSRVDRLEKEVFKGQPPQTFNSLTARVNRLMATVRPPMPGGEQPYGQPIASGAPAAAYPQRAYPAAATPSPLSSNYQPYQQYQPYQGYQSYGQPQNYPNYPSSQNYPNNQSYQNNAAQQGNDLAGVPATTSRAPKTDAHPLLHRLASVLGGLGTAAASMTLGGGYLGGFGGGYNPMGGFGYGSPGYGGYNGYGQRYP